MPRIGVDSRVHMRRRPGQGVRMNYSVWYLSRAHADENETHSHPDKDGDELVSIQIPSSQNRNLSPAMSWYALPAELHLAIVLLLPPNAIRALSCTSTASRALCLPAIFANVILPSAASLQAFARHVPSSCAAYVKSLSICTKPSLGATGAPSTDLVLAILDSCTRLQSLALSLASSIDPEKAVPAFSRLLHVRSFEMGCWGTEDVAPMYVGMRFRLHMRMTDRSCTDSSERLVVALAASLPSLTHLTLSRITRSAVHVDPCDVPYGVPIVTNDFDVPPHPLLGSDLALPNLLRLASLRTLDIRDTWLGCDTKIEIDHPPALQKLVLTGSMYSADTRSESQACSAWLFACPSLCSLELGTSLAPPLEPSTPPRVSHVHINASRIPVDDLSSTLDALQSCAIESISIGYEQARLDDAPLKDDFARECALDDLQDWSVAIEAFLEERSREEWSQLSHVDVFFTPDVLASWEL